MDLSGHEAFRSEEPLSNALEFSEGLCAVSPSPGGRWGFIDREGKYAIKPKFSKVSSFSEGLAPIYLNGRWGFIDKSGQFVIKPQFDYCLQYSEGLAAVLVNHRVGFIDKRGRFPIKPRYDGAQSFSEGLTRVTVRDRLTKVFHSTVIDMDGRTIFELNKIKQTGEFVVKPVFPFADSFSEGVAVVATNERKFGFIDRSGAFVIPPRFEIGATSFREGRACIGLGPYNSTGRVTYL
ncbi:MAG TPA: WG repeat-containing protein [Planktothrix sp.]